jgi:hypothetical protein
MDDRLRLFLFLLAHAGSMAVLGAVFGAVVGAWYYRSGKAAGTYFGLSVARAFARVSEREFSRGTLGAIIGAVDGLIFLGMIGMVIGAIQAYQGEELKILGPVLLVAALMAGAVYFGVIARGLIRAPGRTATASLVGGAIGFLVAVGLDGRREDLLAVSLFGGLLGAFIGALGTPRRRHKPHDRESPDPS